MRTYCDNFCIQCSLKSVMWRSCALTRGQQRARRSLVTAWVAAVHELPRESILPRGLGGEEDITVAAWHGDKLLSAAVANALRRLDDGPRDVKELTNLHQLATSNDFLLSVLDDILPQHKDIVSKYQNMPHEGIGWRVGTMVEAAVLAVYDGNNGGVAVTDLAQWLVNAASVSKSQLNAKGALLELGGTVHCERAGGHDHAPIWRVVAELGGSRLTVTKAGAKRTLEQEMAAKILDSAFGDY
jgi:hypothetical protein